MECSKCHVEKPGISFATFKTRTGEKRQRGICKVCRGLRAKENFEHLQEWRRKYNEATKTKRQLRGMERRRVAKEFVDALKNAPCADCGNVFHPVAMDFDHVGDDKVMGVSTLVGSAYNLDLIREEIAKCELVCANCHRVRTHLRKQNLSPNRL